MEKTLVFEKSSKMDMEAFTTIISGLIKEGIEYKINNAPTQIQVTLTGGF